MDRDEEDMRVPLIVSVDEMIEQSIGYVNLTQILQMILVSLPFFFDNQQTFITVFAHAQPKWHCTSNNTSSSSCSTNSNICDLSETEWGWDSGNIHTSIISEWNLQCVGSIFAGMPGTAYFIGCFLGGLLLATLGDSSLGRKNLLCISSLVMSLAALASAFSPNIWVYSVFRFLCGIGRASVGSCALVLLTEKVGKRWRPLATMVMFAFFSLGMLSLTGIAYLTRDLSWRSLYIWTSIPAIICTILCHVFLYDSPRWLFMQGRGKDAMEVLRRLGAITQIRSSLPNMNIEHVAHTTTTTTTTTSNHFISVMIILSRPWAVKRLVASSLLAFAIGLTYFGMFLAVENLGFDIYLNLVFHALLSLASIFLIFMWWVHHCDRKTSLLGFCTISGVLCIAVALIGKGHGIMVVALELVSLFWACMADYLFFMYMVELFPTCIRSSSLSLIRQAMTLGSVFDPVLVLLGENNLIYSYGVFGLVILLCGFLVIYLPETRGKVLCDTMEEQESSDSDNKFVS